MRRRNPTAIGWPKNDDGLRPKLGLKGAARSNHRPGPNREGVQHEADGRTGAEVMRQAIFSGPGALAVETGPVPSPTGQEVLVRVEACGICGTDRQILAGTHPASPPVVLGHEYAGTVVDAGPDVLDLKVGDRVAVDPNIVCRRCRFCRLGRVQLCERITPLGIELSGGFAEYSVVPEANAYRVPEAISSVAAALVEPLACCIRGSDRAGVRLGDVVVVLGAGPIGLLHMQLARLRGAATVISVDPIPDRRELADRLGSDMVVDGDEGNIREVVSSATAGRGADVVIEASGNPDAALLSADLAGEGGNVLWFGSCPEDATVTVRPFHINDREITLLGSNLNPFTHQTALDLIEHGRILLDELVTDRVSLDDLDRVLQSADRTLGKIIVEPATP